MEVKNVSDIGLAVRKARKALGVTQAQLAMAAGVGVRFMVDLEAGKETLTLAPALRVIDTLGGRVAIEGFPGGEVADGN